MINIKKIEVPKAPKPNEQSATAEVAGPQSTAATGQVDDIEVFKKAAD